MDPEEVECSQHLKNFTILNMVAMYIVNHFILPLREQLMKYMGGLPCLQTR
jgi:hypothetical protein